MDYDDETTVFDANTINAADDEKKLRNTQRDDGYSYLMKEMEKNKNAAALTHTAGAPLPQIAVLTGTLMTPDA